MVNYRRVTFSLDDETRLALEECARLSSRTKSGIVRQAILRMREELRAKPV